MLFVLPVLLFWAGLPAQAAEGNPLIRTMCQAAFDSAMAEAGKTPPQGMGDFTCSCFIKQVEQGSGFDTAKETCKQAAVKKYPM